MVTDAQKKASAKYEAEHTVRVTLKLNKIIDKDILDKLDDVGNKQGYIKELIRNDLKANK